MRVGYKASPSTRPMDASDLDFHTLQEPETDLENLTGTGFDKIGGYPAIPEPEPHFDAYY